MEATSDHSQQNDWVRVAVLFLLLLFIGFGGLIYILNNNKHLMGDVSQKSTQAPVTEISPTIGVKGSMNIISTTPTSRLGRPTSVSVTGDSEGKDIVGFDILISYDSTILRIGQVTPLTSDFQISSYTKNAGIISITGTKSSTVQSESVLTNEELLSISFTPLKRGSADVTVRESINNESSKYIDMNFQQFTPRVNSVRLEIL